MQNQLLESLKTEYPDASVVLEENFIDVAVRTTEKLILFEIKSDQLPRTVIRNALGQILEYAYHPTRTHDLPLELVIVGRKQPTHEDAQYLWYLKKNFGLPITYRVVPI